jgi:hypothetical protein
MKSDWLAPAVYAVTGDMGPERAAAGPPLSRRDLN